MNMNDLTKSQKLTISAMGMALYIAILYTTQGISFGPIQVRIATSLYALSYFFPFLILPMGLANLISNLLFGGLGIFDILGGCVVGILTTSLIAGIRKYKLPIWLCALPITFVPGLGVAIWLSILLHIPYLPLAGSLCMGQAIPAVCGVCFIHGMQGVIQKKGVAA